MGTEQDSQDDGDQQGAGEGEQQDDGGSLLDDDAGQGDGGDDGGDGGADAGNPDIAAIVSQAVEQAIAAANSVADRRINQVLSRLEGQKPDEKDKPAVPAVPAGPDPIAVRSARLAFREYLTADLQFLGNEEREFAMQAGAAAIAARTQIDDEDVVGREVAGQVVQQVRTMRKFYEDRTKAALKKRGMLVESPKGQQPANSGGGGVGATSEFEKGKQVAAGLFPAAQS